MMLPPPVASASRPAPAVAGGIGFFMQTLDATIVNTAPAGPARDLEREPAACTLVIGVFAGHGGPDPRLGLAGGPLPHAARVFVGHRAVRGGLGAVGKRWRPLPLCCRPRVVQGLGGALLPPVEGYGAARLPREEFISAMSWWPFPPGGPLDRSLTLGGWIVEQASH